MHNNETFALWKIKALRTKYLILKKEYDHLLLQEQINEGMLRMKVDSADDLNSQGLYKEAAPLYRQADSMVILSKAMRDRRKKLAEHLFKVD